MLKIFIATFFFVTVPQVIMVRQSPVIENYLVGNAEFSANVYQKIASGNNDNFVFCPTSVQLVLALVQYGARNKTSRQLATALNLPQDREQLMQTFRELNPILRGNDQFTLESANKIYVKKDYEISPSFRNVAVNIFNVDISNIDFHRNTVAAQKINSWISQVTHNKISGLISPTSLNQYTRMVLVNAIYFKGKWVYNFNPEVTDETDFHLDNTHKKKVNTMFMTTRLNYHNSLDLKASFVELPYEGNNITMTIVLPHSYEGLAQVEERLSEVLRPQPFKKEEVHVQLPKFSTDNTVDFNTILQQLEVSDAFDDEKSNIRDIGTDGESLKIDSVFQRASIDVDEKGTIATASSYGIVAIPISANFVPPPLPILFQVNHPFIYFIKSPAGILFVGRYVK